MGNAYAQAHARAAGESCAPPPQALALDQRQVSTPDKSHRAKRKREEGTPAGATDGGSADEVRSCVKPEVWKAAKAAAAKVDAQAARASDQKNTQIFILDHALRSGMGGRDAGSRFLAAYPDVPGTQLTPEGEELLAQRMLPLLQADSCTVRQLADALDLVRRLPAQHRHGEAWRMGDMAMALLPLAVVADVPLREKLVTALTVLLSDQGAAGAGEGKRECGFAGELARSGLYESTIEWELRACVGRLLQGQLPGAAALCEFRRLFAALKQAAEEL